MKTVLAACTALILAMPAHAAEPATAMTAFATEQARAWVLTPEIISAINAQNLRSSPLSQADIDGLDANWRAQIGQSNAPLIDAVMDNAASAYLAARVGEANGVITEVFVMDARGLNVAASAVTSDYWQGDEAKHQETYSVGADAVHVSEIELDESTQAYQAQVSMSITDPATGEVIGAVTFGLDAQVFF